MTLCMCFVETLTIAFTVSDIFAQIDHKGPNLIENDLYRVIPHLAHFRMVLVSHQR